MHYFNNIGRPEDFTSQCFKTITLSDHQACISKHSYKASMMNTICRSHSNGLHCLNCDLQDLVFCGVDFVLLRPKTNEDHFRKQVALRINVTPINNLGMRKVSLHHLRDEISFQRERRLKFSMCGINCNQKHNLLLSISLLPMLF